MQQPQQPTPKKQNVHWLWWILAIVLLIWNILTFLPKSKPEINIPYTQFGECRQHRQHPGLGE
jgi:ABC-type phosphate/phosphonate transport system permease subunit